MRDKAHEYSATCYISVLFRDPRRHTRRHLQSEAQAIASHSAYHGDRSTKPGRFLWLLEAIYSTFGNTALTHIPSHIKASRHASWSLGHVRPCPRGDCGRKQCSAMLASLCRRFTIYYPGVLEQNHVICRNVLIFKNKETLSDP